MDYDLALPMFPHRKLMTFEPEREIMGHQVLELHAKGTDMVMWKDYSLF